MIKVMVEQPLAICEVFRELTDEQLMKVAALCSKENYDGGATVFRQGSMAEKVYVLIEGKVALQMVVPAEPSDLRKRVTVEVLRDGEFLGWSGLVEPYVYTLSATCLQTTTLLAIDAKELSSLLQEDCQLSSEVFQGLNKTIAARLADTRRMMAIERCMV